MSSNCIAVPPGRPNEFRNLSRVRKDHAHDSQLLCGSWHPFYLTKIPRLARNHLVLPRTTMYHDGRCFQVVVRILRCHELMLRGFCTTPLTRA